MMTIKKSRHSRHAVNFKDIDENSTSSDDDHEKTNTKQKKLDPFPNDSEFNTNFVTYTDIGHNTHTKFKCLSELRLPNYIPGCDI